MRSPAGFPHLVGDGTSSLEDYAGGGLLEMHLNRAIQGPEPRPAGPALGGASVHERPRSAFCGAGPARPP